MINVRDPLTPRLPSCSLCSSRAAVTRWLAAAVRASYWRPRRRRRMIGCTGPTTSPWRAHAAPERVATPDFDDAFVKVHARPPQHADLATPDPRGHHEPDERSPVVVHLERRFHQLRGHCWRRRVGLRRLLPRSLGCLRGVGAGPVPPNGSVHRAADDRVNLAHGRRGHRLARVQLAFRGLAVMLPCRLVLDERPPVTTDATAP